MTVLEAYQEKNRLNKIYKSLPLGDPKREEIIEQFRKIERKLVGLVKTEPAKEEKSFRSLLNSRWLYIGIIVALLFWVFYGQSLFRQPVMPTVIKEYKTDTVYVNRKVEVIRLKHVPTAPKTITVYLPDTVRRKQMERDTLISGLTLKGGKLELQTISPTGIGIVSSFPLKDLPISAITIDQEGKVNVEVDEKEVRRQKRNKTWRKIGNGAITVAAFAMGVFVAR